MQYRFNVIEKCNMCGSISAAHQVLGKRLNTSQGLRPSKKVGIATTILKCTNCNLIYSSPQPIPINIQDHYGVLPEEYWASGYFDEEININGLLVKLRKHLNFSNPICALDIGAGIGKMMMEMIKNNIEAYGIEPSLQFYEQAIRKHSILQGKIKCEKLEDVEFEKEKFDYITFGAVLEHLEDPANSINKALSWLKPGGIIQIQVPSSKWLIGKIFNMIYRVTGSDFCSNLSPMHSPYHLYEFDEKSFQFHAKKNNYSIVDVEYGVCNTFLPKIFDPILKPLMRKTNTGMEIYVLLKKNK